MISRPRCDIWQARPTASAISAMGYRFMSLPVAKLDQVDQVATVRVASAGLLRALSVHAWCEDKVPMVRVSDGGLKPAAAFVI